MEFFRRNLKRIKLFVLYWTRIVFVRNNFKVGFFTKLKANIFGGYLADQYVLYDFKHNDKKEFLSEFDWYRSRYINEPFDFAFNNKVVCAEILKQHIRVAEKSLSLFQMIEIVIDLIGNFPVHHQGQFHFRMPVPQEGPLLVSLDLFHVHAHREGETAVRFGFFSVFLGSDLHFLNILIFIDNILIVFSDYPHYYYNHRIQPGKTQPQNNRKQEMEKC